MTFFLRAISTVLLAVAAFFVPWWIVFMLGLLLSLLFCVYAEFIIVAFLMDAVYAGSGVSIVLIPWFTLGALAVVVVTDEIRRLFRFSDSSIDSLAL